MHILRYYISLTTLLMSWLAGPVRPIVSAVEIAPEVVESQQNKIAVIARASAASVSLLDGTGQGGGSGVVISPDGFALSNFHVTSPAGNFIKCTMPDGHLYDAVVVGLDPTGDVALIKLVNRENFTPATLGNSDLVRVGDWCFVVGNPFLLSTDFQPSVSSGIVSGIHRYQYPAGTLLEYADCIQTDAAINPGNSGGPLFGSEGQLIGINGRGSFEKRGRVNVGVGYAISINQIKNFLGYLKSGRIVDHATLGTNVSTDEDGRVIVTDILESSDAYRRGLRYGDEIVRFADRRIQSANALKNVLGTLPKGWRVPISYRRDGVRYDRVVRLSGVHTREDLLQKADRGIAPPSSGPPHPQPEGPSRTAKSPEKPSIPQKLRQLFEPRRGYANYYFNQQHRSRVWDSFQHHTGTAPDASTWNARGELSDGGTFELSLRPQLVSAQLENKSLQIDVSLDLSSQLVPENSGGLLAALHAWHRLLTSGPAKYGEVYYLGTAPIPGQAGLYDVLVATHNVVETWFYFDPRQGQLVLAEMFGERDRDPCEIYFDDYQSVQDVQLPHQLKVRYGDETFQLINIHRWALVMECDDAT